jgi:hypothetical protein
VRAKRWRVSRSSCTRPTAPGQGQIAKHETDSWASISISTDLILLGSFDLHSLEEFNDLGFLMLKQQRWIMGFSAHAQVWSIYDNSHIGILCLNERQI